ncbi:TPA: host specificity protein J [Escherichia coli]|nr:host specificity protein J [Escherichia coli]
MGKGSSKGHTPREAKDNLKSTQLLSVIDAISEGPIEGPVDGLKSVLLNSTPVLDSDALYAGMERADADVRAGPTVG